MEKEKKNKSREFLHAAGFAMYEAYAIKYLVEQLLIVYDLLWIKWKRA